MKPMQTQSTTLPTDLSSKSMRTFTPNENFVAEKIETVADRSMIGFQNNFAIEPKQLSSHRLKQFKRELEILSLMNTERFVIPIGYSTDIKYGCFLLFKWYDTTFHTVLENASTISRSNAISYTTQLLQILTELQDKDTAILARRKSILPYFLQNLLGYHRRRKYLVHNDIKGDNIYIDKNKQLKLADFGAAVVTKHYYETWKDIECVYKIIVADIWAHRSDRMPEAIQTMVGNLASLKRKLKPHYDKKFKKSKRKNEEQECLMNMCTHTSVKDIYIQYMNDIKKFDYSNQNSSDPLTTSSAYGTSIFSNTTTDTLLTLN